MDNTIGYEEDKQLFKSYYNTLSDWHKRYFILIVNMCSSGTYEQQELVNWMWNKEDL